MPWRQQRLAGRSMAFVLAGGRGSRLHELTNSRVKPAVYFGGKTRIIDFALSNALNSGIRKIALATQYKAHSLIRHVQRGWNFFRAERNEFMDILPASQRLSEEHWYRGTADAVTQNIDIVCYVNFRNRDDEAISLRLSKYYTTGGVAPLASQQKLFGDEGGADVNARELKVGKSSDPMSTAGFVAARAREGIRLILKAVGHESVFNCVYALGVARSYLRRDSLDVSFKPELINKDIDGQTKTVVQFTCLVQQT